MEKKGCFGEFYFSAVPWGDTYPHHAAEWTDRRIPEVLELDEDEFWNVRYFDMYEVNSYLKPV